MSSVDLFVHMDSFGPEKIICVSDPKVGMKGVLVIDNTARGMGKGGCRMSLDVTVGEICSLARVMTWKWAMADLFFGGAKAGIQADPGASNKEAVLRSFVRALKEYIPKQYVFGLDMGLTELDAAIVIDELDDRHASVGTPAELGGIPYDEWGATGYGVAQCSQLVVQSQNRSPEEMTVAIQGFGAVGAAAAKFLDEIGMKVVSVSSAKGALLDEKGLPVKELLQLQKQYGKEDFVQHYSGERKPLGSELFQSTDILILAAGGGAITEVNADGIAAGIIVEGANMPVTKKAEEVLLKKGKVILPDFVANAGGIIAAAVAMEKRDSSIPPEPQQVYQLIGKKIRNNVLLIQERGAEENRSLREVALTIAKERVKKAIDLRAGNV